MILHLKYVMAAAVLCLSGTPAIKAQSMADADTTNTKSAASSANNSMFMDASSDSKPRQVSLGLPTTSTSTVQIFEDGLPVSYYLYQLYPYKSWHGGASAESQGSMGPLEAAMRYGEINYFVDGHNRTGSEKFRGSVNYTVGMYGQHKFDMNISGPIARGWQYSISTYQNFDPGSNHTVTPYLHGRHQFYKGAISKTFAGGRGKTALVYQYVNYLEYLENYGPFVFVGDGSVKLYDGFDLGHDSFRPQISSYTFMDFKTGEMRTMNFDEGNTDKSHHLTWTLGYDFDNGMRLDVRSRFKTGTSLRGSGSLSGIENVTAGSGYTYEDGSEFSGYVQKRMILHFDAFETSWLNNAELKFARGNHSMRAGVDYNFTHGGTISSSAMFSHTVDKNPVKFTHGGTISSSAMFSNTVSKDPVMLYFHGNEFYNFNTGGEYYDGHEHKTAGYVYDEWTPNKRLDLQAFVRAEWLNIHGDALNNIGDDTSNTRYSGFNVTLGKITPFHENFLNGAFGADVVYKIVGGLCAIGDFTFTRVHSNIFNYGGFVDPNTDPSDTKLIRAGLSYGNKVINIQSQINWIRQDNYNTRSIFQHALSKAVGEYPEGYVESMTMPVTYGISSLGWVTDAMITPGNGFSLHLQFTLRNPLYKDFIFTPTFSDGVQLHYDFSDKNVTNLHKVEICADPSYSVGDFRFWLSGRYISKQYINKANSLYFSGRVETFGGIDYKMNEKTKISLNVVNLLNQKGASGKISSADLVEDVSEYHDYIMSGTFIRPFTLELGVNIDF